MTVALAYAFLTTYGKKRRSISAAAAMLRGFHSINPLTEIERRHLHLLIACRLACSVTMGAYSIRQNPENEYLRLHSVPAWETLEMIWGTDAMRRTEMSKALSQIFDQACKDIPDPNADVLDCSDLAFPDPSIGDPLSSIRISLSHTNHSQETSNGDHPSKRQKSQ